MVTKPKPPANLWEKLDDIRKQIQRELPPENAISARKYAEKYGLGRNEATADIRMMISKGKLKPWGKYKGVVYYEVV